jgi:hypothetical protein
LISSTYRPLDLTSRVERYPSSSENLRYIWSDVAPKIQTMKLNYSPFNAITVFGERLPRVNELAVRDGCPECCAAGNPCCQGHPPGSKEGEWYWGQTCGESLLNAGLTWVRPVGNRTGLDDQAESC